MSISPGSPDRSSQSDLSRAWEMLLDTPDEESFYFALRLLGIDGTIAHRSDLPASVLRSRFSASEVEVAQKLAEIWPRISRSWGAHSEKDSDPAFPESGDFELQAAAIDDRLDQILDEINEPGLKNKIEKIQNRLFHEVTSSSLGLSGALELQLEDMEVLAGKLGYVFEVNREVLEGGDYLGLRRQLLDLAKQLGHQYSAGYVEDDSAPMPLYALDELFLSYDSLEEGVEEAARILHGQLQAIEIQANTLQDLFEGVDRQELIRAAQAQLTAEVNLSPDRNRYWQEVRVEGTPFYATFFRNERGELEYLLVCDKEDPNRKGTYKQYRAAGTIADIESVAHLDVKFKLGERGQVESEIRLWRNLQELGIRHIPRFLDRRLQLNRVIILAEGFDVDAHALIKAHKNDPEFREQLFHLAAKTLLEHLSDLHHHRYVNFDIKPGNLVVRLDKETGEPIAAAVIDFGFTKQMRHDLQRVTLCGTPFYLDPYLFHTRKGGPATDIWSTAASLAEIRYGQPLCFLTRNARGERCLKKGRLPTQPEIIAEFEKISGRQRGQFDHFDRLILSMAEADPSQRLSAREALEMYNAEGVGEESP